MKTLVTWDLGGTNCRVALIECDQKQEHLHCVRVVQMPLKEADSLDHLTQQLEDKLHFRMQDADAICIGAAGIYNGHTLSLQNLYPYPMHFAELARKRGWPHFDIIHDYASIVCATFLHDFHDANYLEKLNNKIPHQYGRRVAFGMGTGLGLKDGVMLENGDFWLGSNEMGHIGIIHPPETKPHLRERHNAIINFLMSHNDLLPYEPLTFEKILTGKGLVRLYQFLYPNQKNITPEEVGLFLSSNKSTELSDIFAYYIGLFIGTLQLTFMPDGGIWITGGIAMKHLNLFKEPSLFEGINASPAYLTQRENYALSVMHHPHQALLGTAFYAMKRLLLTDYKHAV